MAEGMSVGMVTIIMEDFRVEADTLGIKRIDHDDQSSVVRA